MPVAYCGPPHLSLRRTVQRAHFCFGHNSYPLSREGCVEGTEVGDLAYRGYLCSPHGLQLRDSAGLEPASPLALSFVLLLSANSVLARDIQLSV